MESNLLIINIVLLVAGFYLRSFLPPFLIFPCYVLLILIPQMILMWFESREAVESYQAYRQAKIQEKVFSGHHGRKKYKPVLHLKNLHTLLGKARINPTRAGPLCVVR